MNIRKYKMFTILIMAVFLFSACVKIVDDNANRLKIVNHTNKEIGCQYLYSEEKLVSEDTLLQRFPPILGVEVDSFRIEVAPTLSDWKQELHGYEYMQILILDITNYIPKNFKWFNSAPIDTLRKYVPVLQRYQLSKQDLEELRYTITYPPTEEMRNVKMWPPYHKGVQFVSVR